MSLDVSSVDVLIKYYDLFKSRQHNLKIAIIFSYETNENDKNANGIYTIDFDDDNGSVEPTKEENKHSREKLDEFIVDYNKMFKTNFSTKDSQSYYNYYNDISKQVKSGKIDILLVVNMFLTGFDSKTLNTLYVDKHLQYHGLIQAFSRTNRILNEQKSQGNIVCFRNLKERTDDAIALFSNKEAKDIILIEPYERYVEAFNKAVISLKKITSTVESVNDLVGEDLQLDFIKTFRDLMRINNVLDSFAEFQHSDLSLSQQEYEDYKSKCLDLYEKIKSNNNDDGKVSILDDIDFELELIHKDEINVIYILQLLARLKDDGDASGGKEGILNIINGQKELRSKKELIEKFIDENLMKINTADIEKEFDAFVDIEKGKAFNELCDGEGLDQEKAQSVIDTYLYDQRKPLPDEIIGLLTVKPKFLARKKIKIRVLDRLMVFIGKYLNF